MVVGSVLILTARFGEGHNAAANNLAAALRKYHPEVRVSVHDIFEESYGWMNSLAQSLYRLVINYAPGLWEMFFCFLDRSSVPPWILRVFSRAERKLREKIQFLDADVVVSTYPGYGQLIDGIAPSGKRKFTFVTIVTDSLTINSIWYRCSCDHYLVPNEPTARVMQQAGVRNAKLHVTGFPTPLEFSNSVILRKTPPDDGCWKVLFMVNSAPEQAPDIVRELLAIECIALAVTCGRNTTLLKSLQSLAKDLGKPIELHGWTPEMPQIILRSHILIGKAGGATVQEALAAQIPMVVTQIVPGQEEGNARLIIEAGAGEFASKPKEIATALRRIFEVDGAIYKNYQRAAASLGHPTAARDGASFIAAISLHE
jgi:processive 1,2-diacylglycerol beta-glucosyltransferase